MDMIQKAISGNRRLREGKRVRVDSSDDVREDKRVRVDGPTIDSVHSNPHIRQV